MMKKISRVLLICGIAAVLTACGPQANPAANLAQDINIGDGNAANTEYVGNEGEMADNESEASAKGKPKEEGVFGFLYEGVTLVPGEEFDKSALGKYKGVLKVSNCALGGSDNVYNYGTFELTARVEEDVERICSIYFIDSNLATTEGLHLGDSVDDMKALYGEDYEAEGNAYVYTRGETTLTVIVGNEAVASIEYGLVK